MHVSHLFSNSNLPALAVVLALTVSVGVYFISLDTPKRASIDFAAGVVTGSLLATFYALINVPIHHTLVAGLVSSLAAFVVAVGVIFAIRPVEVWNYADAVCGGVAVLLGIVSSVVRLWAVTFEVSDYRFRGITFGSMVFGWSCVVMSVLYAGLLAARIWRRRHPWGRAPRM